MKRLLGVIQVAGGALSILVTFGTLSAFMAMELGGFVSVAHAGEKYLGSLVVSDGGTVANPCSGWGAYKGDAGAFGLPSLALVTIQCDGIAYVLTDVAGCDAGRCVYLAANTPFPTSVNGAKSLACKAFASDGGVAGHAVTYSGGWLAMSPDYAAGASTVTTCKVFDRSGKE